MFTYTRKHHITQTFLNEEIYENVCHIQTTCFLSFMQLYKTKPGPKKNKRVMIYNQGHNLTSFCSVFYFKNIGLWHNITSVTCFATKADLMKIEKLSKNKLLLCAYTLWKCILELCCTYDIRCGCFPFWRQHTGCLKVIKDFFNFLLKF